ncbi:MAG: hypothetical protein AB4426_35375 [Xenococcaceae cyanobacterium]
MTRGAGSAAAMSLKKFRAIEVLLLELATFPRRQPCGIGLSSWTLEHRFIPNPG